MQLDAEEEWCHRGEVGGAHGEVGAVNGQEGATDGEGGVARGQVARCDGRGCKVESLKGGGAGPLLT